MRTPPCGSRLGRASGWSPASAGRLYFLPLIPFVATAHDTPPADTESDGWFWCFCDGGADDAFYSPDGWCKCGEHKHHYHCQRCLGICQVG